MQSARWYYNLDEPHALVEEFQHSILDRDAGSFTFSTFHAQDHTGIHAKATGTDLPFNDDVIAKLLRLIGVPAGAPSEYASDPELLERLIMHSQNKRQTMPVRLTSIGRQIVAAAKSTGPGLSFGAAWSAIRDQPAVVGVHSIDRAGNAFELRVVSGVADESPGRVGDISHAGVSVTLNGRATVRPYVFRLACRNGLVGQKSLWSETPKELVCSAEYRKALADCVRRGLEASRTVLEAFLGCAKVHVKQPANLLIQLLREAGVPRGHIGEIVRTLPALRSETSVYDVVNLITDFGRDRKKARDRERFERVGGEVLEKAGGHRCDHCTRLVA